MAINVTPPSSPSAPIPSATNTQMDVQLFAVKDITGASPGAGLADEYVVGDLLQREVTYTDGVIDSTVWSNITQGHTLTVVPPGVDLILKESNPLTDAELRAAPVEVIVTNQVETDPASNYETVVSLYEASVDSVPAGQYTAGDIIQSTELLDKGTNPATILSTVWKNVTTNTDNITVSTADLIILPSSALTNAELRASPVDVNITDNKNVIVELFTANVDGIDYVEGDVLRRVSNHNTSDGTYTLYWENVTQGTAITNNPIGSHLSIASGGGALDTETEFYVATVDNATTGAVKGDELVRIATYDSDQNVILESWKNITTGATLFQPPLSGEYKVFSGSPDSNVNTIDVYRIQGPGIVPQGAYDISIANIGGGDGIIGGATIPSGYSMDFRADPGDYLEQLVYDATGTDFIVTVINSVPASAISPVVFQPAIFNPTTAETEVALGPTFTASTYNQAGNAGAHGQSEWEVYSDGTLTTLVEAVNQPSMLTSMTLTNPLDMNTNYWVRVRYISVDGVASDWSQVVNFTTISSAPMIVTMAPTAPQTVYITVKETNSPCTIDWGDGTVDDWYPVTIASHNYASAGTYTVRISGHRSISFGAYDYQAGIIEVAPVATVEQWGSASWTDISGLFRHPYWNQGNINPTINATDYPDLSQCTNVANIWNVYVNPTSLEWLNPGQTGLTTLKGIFYGLTTSIWPADLTTWDTSGVTDFSEAFRGCTGFNADVSGWNTSSATDMNRMFMNCEQFNQDVSGFDVSNVTDLSYMFYQAQRFNQDISGWDTSSCTNMSAMFYQALKFNMPIGGWDVSNVEDFSYMFAVAVEFNQPIGDWNTSSARGDLVYYSREYTAFDHMFAWATAFRQDLTKWSTPLMGTKLPEDFTASSGLSSGGNTYPANNYNLRTLEPFWGAPVITDPTRFIGKVEVNYQNYKVNLGNINVISGGTAYIDWGDGTVSTLTQANSNLEHTYADRTREYTVQVWGDITSFNFLDANTAYPSNRLIDVAQFGTDIVWTSMENMFSKTSINTKDVRNDPVLNQYIWTYSFHDVPNLTQCTNLQKLFHNSYEIYQDLSSWDVSNVTNFNNCFSAMYDISYVQVSHLDISGWSLRGDCEGFLSNNGYVTMTGVTGSNITNLAYAFSRHAVNWADHAPIISAFDITGCTNLRNTFASAYVVDTQGNEVSTPVDLDLSGWDTSAVTDFMYLFGDFKLNSTTPKLGIEGWNTSSVTTMYGTFAGLGGSFYGQTLDLTGWDTSSVTDMQEMFRYVNDSTMTIDMTGWDTSSVTDMSGMFGGNWWSGAPTFAFPNYLGVENFNTSNVTRMSETFSNVTNMNIDISGWDTSNVTYMYGMFSETTITIPLDLSGWCVTNITTVPGLWPTDQSNLTDPVWGTCP